MLTAATSRWRGITNRWTHTSVVGVDVGSSSVKVIELSQHDGQVVIERYAVAPIAEQGATAAVRRAMREARITSKRVAIGVSSAELIVRPFQLPVMPAKELQVALRRQAEAMTVDRPASGEVAIDWHVVSTSNQSIRGILAVVPKTLIAGRIALATAAGLRPVVVDVEGLALWNAYWAFLGHRAARGRTVLLVNLGHRTTNLVIARDRDELLLVRDVSLGSPALRQRQDDWASELTDALAQAQTVGGLTGLETAIVTGGGSSPAAASLVRSLTNAPVSLWNPLGAFGEELLGESSAAFGVAIGLALRRPAS